MTASSDRLPTSRIASLAIAALAIVLMAACGGAGSASPTATGKPATTKRGSAAAPVALKVDPCTLLTIPEMETAIGSGVERGGFSVDTPGSCTFSIGRDVGAGAVKITNADPSLCSALQKALDAGSLDKANAIAVVVGDGGIFEKAAGNLQFSIGGGCISIVASHHGKPLDQNALTTMATAAAGRVS